MVMFIALFTCSLFANHSTNNNYSTYVTIFYSLSHCFGIWKTFIDGHNISLEKLSSVI